MDIEYEDYDYFDYYYGTEGLKTFFLEDIDEAENFYKNHKYEVAELSFNAIKYGMRLDLIQVPVFRFNICGRMASVNLKRSNFDQSLRACIAVFEESEEYEKCHEALSIINSDPFIQSETSNQE
jgi:hypothetical protein